MKRHQPSGLFDSTPFESFILPVAVVDMFGRLFGTIISTIFSDALKTDQKPQIEAMSNLLAEALATIRTQLSTPPRVSEPAPPEPSAPSAPIDGGEPGESSIPAPDDRVLAEFHQIPGTLVVSPNPRAGWCPQFGWPSAKVHVLLPTASVEVPDGIIRYLAKQCGGNVSDKGIVKVGASAYQGSYPPKNATDTDPGTCFYSPHLADQWLAYDFQSSRVVVKCYAIRSWSDSVGGRHPKSWVVEGWNEGCGWIEVDRCEDEGRLNGPDAIVMFEVKKVVESRIVRIRQIGPNWQGNDGFLFKQFEIYGALRIPT
jgi:hypothetical protein